MKSKYHNIPVRLEQKDGSIVRFDSKYEYETWLTIRRAMTTVSSPTKSIFQLVRQKDVLIQPATKNFKKIVWRIDFCIMMGLVPISYIETKGCPTPEFLLKLKIADFNQPEITRNLIIVNESKVKFGKYIPTLNLHSLESAIILNLSEQLRLIL